MGPRTCVVCDGPLSPHPGRGLLCGDLRCRWAYDSTPASQVCGACRRPLAGHAREDAGCTRSECRLQRSRHKQEEEARERARLEEKGRRLRDRGAAAAGVADARAYPLLVVPSFTGERRPLPEQRRAALAGHLDAIIAEAMGDEDIPAPHPREPLPPGAAAVLGQACATCRGHCCRSGKNHAFLNASTIRRVLDADPARTADEVRASYLAALTGEAFEGSCLYHGPRGCVLPREIRSDTCNNFFCPPLQAFVDRLPEAGPYRAFVVSAEEDFGAAFVDEDGSRPVPSPGASAPGN